MTPGAQRGGCKPNLTETFGSAPPAGRPDEVRNVGRVTPPLATVKSRLKTTARDHDRFQDSASPPSQPARRRARRAFYRHADTIATP